MEIAFGGEVDFPSEQLLDLLLELHPAEQADRVLEPDEEIDITLGPGFPPRHRPEHPKVGRAEPAREGEESITVGRDHHRSAQSVRPGSGGSVGPSREVPMSGLAARTRTDGGFSKSPDVAAPEAAQEA